MNRLISFGSIAKCANIIITRHLQFWIFHIFREQKTKATRIVERSNERAYL